MSKDVKEFITSCDICQKSKSKRHAPYGLVRPIPILARPFEVITMDFIPELPSTEAGHDKILQSLSTHLDSFQEVQVHIRINYFCIHRCF